MMTNLARGARLCTGLLLLPVLAGPSAAQDAPPELSLDGPPKAGRYE
jgi:hypothetical protein